MMYSAFTLVEMTTVLQLPLRSFNEVQRFQFNWNGDSAPVTASVI